MTAIALASLLVLEKRVNSVEVFNTAVLEN